MMLIESIGYLATVLTIGSYAMTNIISLRITSILSSFSFIIYGFLIQSNPVLLTEIILLPLNGFRLYQSLQPLGKAEMKTLKGSLVSSHPVVISADR
jgi:CRP/FNR family cyclic AMP-dependent transcriptional regulator